jgi:hypothetical protein
VIVLATALMSAAPASAEVFLDFYAGASFFGHPDFTITRASGITREVERGTANTDVTFAGRLGSWFVLQGLPWLGVGGDVSYFEPEFTGPQGGDLATVKVRTCRLPLLQSPEYPGGQLQIYTGVGPGFFWTEQTARFSGAGSRGSPPTQSR